MPERYETPSTILIDQHYREIGLDQGWKKDRVLRLCQMLHATPHELGKLCCIGFGQMTGYLKTGHFPPHIALHFALLESWYTSEVLKLPQKPVMPIQHLA